jgi:hypothetical protein
MFNSFWAGARRSLPGSFEARPATPTKPPVSRRSAIPTKERFSRRSATTVRLALGVCFCAILWATAHHGVGFYLDRAHSKGNRVYRVNSYEQFIKRKVGEGPIALVAGNDVLSGKILET